MTDFDLVTDSELLAELLKRYDSAVIGLWRDRSATTDETVVRFGGGLAPIIGLCRYISARVERLVENRVDAIDMPESEDNDDDETEVPQ